MRFSISVFVKSFLTYVCLVGFDISRKIINAEYQALDERRCCKYSLFFEIQNILFVFRLRPLPYWAQRIEKGCLCRTLLEGNLD